jgi:COP9 signalosome complex subunit 1
MQRNYSHIGTYVYKAESALEMNSATGGSASARRAAASDAAASEAFRERVQSKIDLATALANLAQGHYEKAARGFLKIKNIKSLDHWAQVLDCSVLLLIPQLTKY